MKNFFFQKKNISQDSRLSNKTHLLKSRQAEDLEELTADEPLSALEGTRKGLTILVDHRSFNYRGGDDDVW